MAGVRLPRITTADLIFDRIIWDQSLAPQSDFVVGYEDRFLGLVEVAFDKFDKSEIPFHRRLGKVVWDRPTHVDLLTHPDFVYPFPIPEHADARPAPPPKPVLPVDASKREEREARAVQSADQEPLQYTPVFSRVAVKPQVTSIPPLVLARKRGSLSTSPEGEAQ